MAERIGTSFDDRLIGTDGDDVFIGRSGNDISTGGDGGDRYVYQQLADLTIWNGKIDQSRETITDFGETGSVMEPGENDVLDLSALKFQFIGDDLFSASGRSEIRSSTFGTESLALFFDADGNGLADYYLTLDSYINGGNAGDPVNTSLISSVDLFAFHYQVGTGADEILIGTDPNNNPNEFGDDRIYGFGGDDRLYARGGFGNELFGGDGNDRLVSDTGVAHMEGGSGDDAYYVSSEFDQVIEEINSGVDTINSSADYFGSTDNVENFTLIGQGRQIGGNDLNNIISGNGLDNLIYGGGGDDSISGGSGSDHLLGELGNDWIRGGIGGDLLEGGVGSDHFVYFNASEIGRASSGNGDVIVDFHGVLEGASSSNRDRIDLHRIDADVSTAVNDAFGFVGASDFSGRAGELRVFASTVTVVDPDPAYGNPPRTESAILVQGDLDGDSKADFELAVLGTPQLQASDFYL